MRRLPEFALKPTGSSGLGSPLNVFALVAWIDGDEAVIADWLFAGEALEWVGSTLGGVQVAVFESGPVLVVRVATASGSGYEATPESTSQRWYESTDGGRTWARRPGPVDGVPVIELSWRVQDGSVVVRGHTWLPKIDTQFGNHSFPLGLTAMPSRQLVAFERADEWRRGRLLPWNLHAARSARTRAS